MSRPEAAHYEGENRKPSWRPLWAARKRRRWSRDLVVRTIQSLYEAGADLSYSGVRASRASLHRAAVRRFGSWRAALMAAEVNPDRVRRRRCWTDVAIVERIRQLAQRGSDLSWTAIVHSPDRALAAAAVRSCHFGSWQAALREAGVGDPSLVRRVARWDTDSVVATIRRRRAESLPLNAKAVEKELPSLFAAARRRFGGWNEALRAAGVDPETVVLRKVRRSAVSTGPA